MTVGSKWDKEIHTIQEFIKAGKSVTEIGEFYGYDKEYMRIVLKRLRKRGILPAREVLLDNSPKPPPIEHQQLLTIEYPDKKEPVLDWRKFLSTAIELQKQKQEKAISQIEATVKITTDQPFAISFTSDWHIGSDYTDYEALLRHIDLWLNTPNLYLGVLGDSTDNFVKVAIKSGMFSALFGPQDQLDVAKAVFKELGRKVIFKQSGNHEGFTGAEAGIDLAACFFEGAGDAPYLAEGGGINLLVNDTITYRLYAKHKYRGFSIYNPTNAPKKMHELESPFDVGIVGHFHSPSFEHTHKWSGAMSKDVIYIVTGSYKVDDKYPRQEGFGARGIIGCPTVVFFPNEKRMIPFRYLEDAVAFLNAFRKEADK